MGYGPAAGAKGGRAYIRRAVERSLRRLRTDYLDLYQIHTPDPVTPVAETLAALTELVTEGKVRYLGNSNFTGWQIADAAHVARAAGAVPFVPRRITGRCWNAGPRRRSCPPPGTSALACCRSTRWRTGCSPGRSARASGCRPGPGWP